MITSLQKEEVDPLDALVLAIRQNGRQSTRIVHKSDAGLVQDCRWLESPGTPTEVGDFLHEKPSDDREIAPTGYGLIAVDFDHQVITSVQGYRDIGCFTADEFGYPRLVGPTWLEWRMVLHHAFSREAVPSAIYEKTARGRCARIPLLASARRKASLALRFAAQAKPAGFEFRGMTFQPPGWKVNHIAGAISTPGYAAERAFTSLSKSGWRCAPLDQWKRCHFG